jgi:hypothetical protein
MSDKRIEAMSLVLSEALDEDGPQDWQDAKEYWRCKYRDLAHKALRAALKVDYTLSAADSASGEKAVWYNGPASGYAIVIDDWMRKTFTEVGPRQITIEVRGEELVVRKRRGG